MGVLAALRQADQWDHGHHGFGADSGQPAAEHERLRRRRTSPRASPSFRRGARGSNCAPAIAYGTYPEVFNNDTVDASFGVTSRMFLDELTPWGQVIDRIAVPDA